MCVCAEPQSSQGCSRTASFMNPEVSGPGSLSLNTFMQMWNQIISLFPLFWRLKTCLFCWSGYNVPVSSYTSSCCKHKRFAAYFTFAFPVEHTPTFVFLSLRGLLLTQCLPQPFTLMLTAAAKTQPKPDSNLSLPTRSEFSNSPSKI